MAKDPELDYVRRRMRELGLNQRSLALQAGCKPDVVRNRLSGKAKRWRQDTRQAIMGILGEPKIYTADEGLMQTAADAVQKAAKMENRNLNLATAMACTVMLYNHVMRIKSKGEDARADVATASLILHQIVA